MKRGFLVDHKRDDGPLQDQRWVENERVHQNWTRALLGDTSQKIETLPPGVLLSKNVTSWDQPASQRARTGKPVIVEEEDTENFASRWSHSSINEDCDTTDPLECPPEELLNIPRRNNIDLNRPFFPTSASTEPKAALQELFPAGRQGYPDTYEVDDCDIVWYKKKKHAEHGAAARRYDCYVYRKWLELDPNGAIPEKHLGLDEPYAEGDGPTVVAPAPVEEEIEKEIERWRQENELREIAEEQLRLVKEQEVLEEEEFVQGSNAYRELRSNEMV